MCRRSPSQMMRRFRGEVESGEDSKQPSSNYLLLRNVRCHYVGLWLCNDQSEKRWLLESCRQNFKYEISMRSNRTLMNRTPSPETEFPTFCHVCARPPHERARYELVLPGYADRQTSRYRFPGADFLSTTQERSEDGADQGRTLLQWVTPASALFCFAVDEWRMLLQVSERTRRG